LCTIAELDNATGRLIQCAVRPLSFSKGNGAAQAILRGARVLLELEKALARRAFSRTARHGWVAVRMANSTQNAHACPG
jgi:hypothetical protein